MNVKRDKLKELIDEQFDGNMTELSRTINIDYSYLNQVYHGRRPSNSQKICEKIIEYCKSKKLDYNYYINI